MLDMSTNSSSEHDTLQYPHLNHCTRPIIPLFRLHLVYPTIKNQQPQHHRLPQRINQQDKRAPNLPISPSPNKAPRHQQHQKPHPPIPRPVLPPPKSLIHKQIYPRRRRHRRRNLRDLQPARHRHLPPRREGQQGNHNPRNGILGANGKDELQRRGGKDHNRLQQVGEQQPPSPAGPGEISDLAGDEAAADKAGERDADAGEVDEVVAEAEDAGGQEDGVAGLVAGEAGVVEEGGDVLHADDEGQDEELGVKEEGVLDPGGEPLMDVELLRGAWLLLQLAFLLRGHLLQPGHVGCWNSMFRDAFDAAGSSFAPLVGWY
jgi:hypothetical protein